ncbi:hypothetical protein ACQP3C_29450, partial [Escherichia coli]
WEQSEDNSKGWTLYCPTLASWDQSQVFRVAILLIFIMENAKHTEENSNIMNTIYQQSSNHIEL